MSSPVKAFIQPTAPTFAELQSIKSVPILKPALRSVITSCPVAISSFPASSPRYTILFLNGAPTPQIIKTKPALIPGLSAASIGYKVIVAFPAIYDKWAGRPYFGQIYPRNILN
jgi:hypothetical protein